MTRPRYAAWAGGRRRHAELDVIRDFSARTRGGRYLANGLGVYRHPASKGCCIATAAVSFKDISRMFYGRLGSAKRDAAVALLVTLGIARVQRKTGGRPAHVIVLIEKKARHDYASPPRRPTPHITPTRRTSLVSMPPICRSNSSEPLWNSRGMSVMTSSCCSSTTGPPSTEAPGPSGSTVPSNVCSMTRTPSSEASGTLGRPRLQAIEKTAERVCAARWCKKDISDLRQLSDCSPNAARACSAPQNVRQAPERDESASAGRCHFRKRGIRGSV